MATRAGFPIAPVLHRSLLTSLLLVTGVLVVLRSGDTGAAPLDGGNQILGYMLSALSFVLVAVAVLFLKPRVPIRQERQPVEEYWSSVTKTILPMWFTMEAAGTIAVVGYFLTGVTVAAVAIAVSIGLFIWYGPKAFAQA
jgi:hypothetical protein